MPGNFSRLFYLSNRWAKLRWLRLREQFETAGDQRFLPLGGICLVTSVGGKQAVLGGGHLLLQKIDLTVPNFTSVVLILS